MLTDKSFRQMREQMVEKQLVARDITDTRVLAAMGRIPRHHFVPKNAQAYAYQDSALPIAEGQTISQPYIVAFMTEKLALRGHERVLEIGTGCGYQTAVLCAAAGYVYTLERHARLAAAADRVLHALGFDNVDIHVGDGSQGLPDMGPFDRIIVTAAAPAAPGPLCWQLDPNGGRLVIPVGDKSKQRIHVIKRRGDKLKIERSMPVRFVPLMGRYGFKPDDAAV